MQLGLRTDVHEWGCAKLVEMLIRWLTMYSLERIDLLARIVTLTVCHYSLCEH